MVVVLCLVRQTLPLLARVFPHWGVRFAFVLAFREFCSVAIAHLDFFTPHGPWKVLRRRAMDEG